MTLDLDDISGLRDCAVPQMGSSWPQGSIVFKLHGTMLLVLNAKTTGLMWLENSGVADPDVSFYELSGYSRIAR
jgi:hypothetical protein